MKAALVWASAHGFLSIAMGAFGAHALKQRLAPEALAWVETGARYEMIAALALLALAALQEKRKSRTWAWEVRAWGWGVVLFSGSLYGMALSGWRFLGAVTPLGGLLMMAAFLMLGWDAFRFKNLKSR